MTKTQNKNIEKKTINKYNLYAAAFALLVVILLLVYYVGFLNPRSYENQIQQTQTTATIEEPKIATGGSCKTNAGCFITTCKDMKTDDCVNTTQLSDYSKNCKSYADWVIKRQDTSRCACVQNICKMIS